MDVGERRGGGMGVSGRVVVRRGEEGGGEGRGGGGWG